MKLIIENWRKFLKESNSIPEPRRKEIEALFDQYIEVHRPKAGDTGLPKDPENWDEEVESAREDLLDGGQITKEEAELFVYGGSTAKYAINESAFLPRVQHAELAHRLAGAVNKFGFRKLSPSEYDDLGKHLESLGTETSPFDARNSIIDFLVGKGLATRSLFYNIK